MGNEAHAVEGPPGLLEDGQPGLQGGRAVEGGEEDLFAGLVARGGRGAGAEGLVGDVGGVEPELGPAAGDELAPVATADGGQGFEVVALVRQVGQQGDAAARVLLQPAGEGRRAVDGVEPPGKADLPPMGLGDVQAARGEVEEVVPGHGQSFMRLTMS